MIYYIVKWIKTLLLAVFSFALTSLPHCFSFLSVICTLSYFEVIRWDALWSHWSLLQCIFWWNTTYKKENLKSDIWVSEFGQDSLCSPRCLKIRFQRIFALSFSYLISNGISGVIWTHWCRLWLCYNFFCSVFSKGTQTFDFI